MADPTEEEKMRMDRRFFGTSFSKDGKRIDPSRVFLRTFTWCDPVRHIPTGATGTVLELLADDMVSVAWDDLSPSTDEFTTDLEWIEQ